MSKNNAMTEVQISRFAEDVRIGLSKKHKSLKSMYFYNAVGDDLFQQITQLEEYYLYRSERHIFKTRKEEILQAMADGDAFRIVELGAGDGEKTKILLDHFLSQQVDFSYCPVDISSNVLELLQATLEQELPDLKMNLIAGDYFQVLRELKFKSTEQLVVFFLGSNIGNFTGPVLHEFLLSLYDNLKTGDRVMIGFDLKKDPQKILNAYNDQKGITRKFNLNLLHRINRELGGNFDIDQFFHSPTYDPESGECRSYLISKKAQEVYIEELGEVFAFEPWEPIFMEVSKKYSEREIIQLAERYHFSVQTNFIDESGYFCESIWVIN